MHRGREDGQYFLKVLIPSYAAGSIIGKGGQTIVQLQKETGATIKLSKSKDFYPGMNDLVDLKVVSCPVLECCSVAIITNNLISLLDCCESLVWVFLMSPHHVTEPAKSLTLPPLLWIPQLSAQSAHETVVF
ncbi:hypothetical protein L345_09184, partial [Ophiophagus hannah]